MKIRELVEDEGKDLVIIYPGRFHPFHIGHGKVYKYLKQKFSNAKVFIATSGKTDSEKSPFTFDEKRKMMILAGVDSSAIVQTRSPYAAMEIVEMFDPDKTIVVYAISEKDMENEPRFDFSGGVKMKKNGEPAHMQKWTGLDTSETVRTHSYIATTPTFPFKIRGAEINSASQIRNMISKSDDTELSQILQDLYNVADIPQDVLEIFKRKIGNSTMNENWNEDLSSAFLLETTPMKINELDAPSKSLSPMQDEYKSNEDNNAHSRNIYILAKEFGTPEEVSEIEKLLKVITRQGYKTPEQSQVMYDMIHTPYYKKLFPSVEEGYTVLPSMDREKYQERPGLEGPFTLRSGKVVYYDVAEGAYYDPDSDIYLSYEEYQAHDDIPHKKVNEAGVMKSLGFSRTEEAIYLLEKQLSPKGVLAKNISATSDNVMPQFEKMSWAMEKIIEQWEDVEYVMGMNENKESVNEDYANEQHEKLEYIHSVLQECGDGNIDTSMIEQAIEFVEDIREQHFDDEGNTKSESVSEDESVNEALPPQTKGVANAVSTVKKKAGYTGAMSSGENDGITTHLDKARASAPKTYSMSYPIKKSPAPGNLNVQSQSRINHINKTAATVKRAGNILTTPTATYSPKMTKATLKSVTHGKTILADPTMRYNSAMFDSANNINEAIGKLNKDGEIEMTKANYIKIHKDFKSKIGDSYMAMQIDPKTGGTALFPVKFIKELTDSVDHFSSIATEIAIEEGADRDSTEYKAGAFAAKNKKAYDSNPHKPGRDRLNWSMGHNEFRAAKLRKAGKPNYGARGQFE